MQNFNFLLKKLNNLKTSEMKVNTGLDFIRGSLNKKNVSNFLHSCKNKLDNSNQTLINSFNYLLHNSHQLDKTEDLQDLVNGRILRLKKHFHVSQDKIAEYTSNKITNKMIVFVHGNCNLISNSLILAGKNKKFEVHLTEGKPFNHGKEFIKKLNKSKLPLKFYYDAAVRQALKKTDLILLSANSITSEGKIMSPIGSEVIAELARNYDIPVYCCVNSLNFNPESIKGVEEFEDVHVKKSKYLTQDQTSYEIISPDLITGVISELGVFKPEVYVEEIKQNYHWMF